MVKFAETGATTFARVRYVPPLLSYLFANDGAAAMTVNLDGATFIVNAGEKLSNSPGETLQTFAVVANAGAGTWRWLGADA